MEICQECGKHCPQDDLQCRRGRRYFEGGNEMKEHNKHRHHKDFNELTIDEKLAVLLRRTGRHVGHRGRGKASQDQILMLLARNETMNQKELQKILDIQPGSLSEVLKKLEVGELIVKTADEEDKRSMNVALADKGKEAVAELRANKEEKISKMFAALDEEEKETLVTLLAKLMESYKGDEEKCGHGHGRHGHGRKGHGHDDHSHKHNHES